MKKLKVLLVDDDEMIRGMYATVFRNEDFEVSEARDGSEGLNKAIKENPDIVFTGIVMPTMDGFQLMEMLSKNVVTSKIPVFISSHLGREEDQRKAKELGAKDFFVRGMYTPNEVVSKIKAMLDASSEYRLKFDPKELDAQNLFIDMHIDKEAKCQKCGKELILLLRANGANKQEFQASFICPECDKEQN